MRGGHAVFSAAFALAGAALACSYSTADSPPVGDAGVDSGGPAKPTPRCDPPRALCGDACVDLGADGRNCGGCGVACGAATACVSSKCLPVGAFVVSRLFLGDTTRAGVTSSTAWRDIGENVDGRTSSAASTDVCTPYAGAAKSVHEDGAGGIDNAWGKAIVPIITGVTPGISQQANDAIASGRSPLVLRFDGYSGQLDLPALPLSALDAAPLGSPRFDGTDRWPIFARSYDGSGAAKVVFAGASVSAGNVTTGARSRSLLLRLPSGTASFDLVIGVARITATLSPKGLAQGTISGVIPVESLVQSFRLALAQSPMAPLCSGSTLDAVLQQVRQAADVLADGSQDPNKPCDGISVGIGFEAAHTGIGDTAADPAPPPNYCP